MRRILTIVLLAVAAAGHCLAQDQNNDYVPTSTWPYIYKEFSEGTLKSSDGKTLTGKYNIHLAKSSLQFIDGELIKEADIGKVLGVQIGEDYYINAGGQFKKVLASNDNGTVILGKEVNIAALNSVGGAYGSSGATLGTTSLTSLEGIGGTRSNMNHMEIRNLRDSGETLPLIEKIYLFGPGFNVFANNTD